MTTRPYVLVGGGVCAAATAAHLRKQGFDGPITLVGQEPDPPYERPPLSKEYLLGNAAEGGFDAQPRDWYADQGVELRLGVRAERLDVDARTVTLATGDRVEYAELVLATGVRPRRLPGLDSLPDGAVLYLRTLADARVLRSRLAEVDRVTVLGAGFVGCEVAAAAVQLGRQVTVFEPEPAPLSRILGARIGAVLLDVHRARGVAIRAGEYVTAAVPSHDGLLLTTSLGDHAETDLIVVGVGSVPNVELAEQAGIAVDNGILTDEYGRTSAPHVHAAGDVVNQLHQGRRVRVEHHDTAQRHGAALGANLAGAAEPYTQAHWFWSDQYEHTLQSVGRLGDPDALVIRGSLEELAFSAFALDGDRVAGVVALNRPRDVIDVRRLLSADHHVTADQLRDESVRLKRLTGVGG